MAARVAQDDGPLPLCQIDYSDHFIDVHDRFRAAVQNEDVSENALQLTEEVIEENSANYTAWWYRRRCLDALQYDLSRELYGFTDRWAHKNLKNYQVWFHRRWLVSRLNNPEGELDFCTECLRGDDQKVYNAWAHRQWIVKKFNLWDGEWGFVDELLEKDVRNNSAWNHRHLLTRKFGVPADEWDYIARKLKKVKLNEAIWNYALAIARETNDWNKLAVLCENAIMEKNRFALHCEIECFIQAHNYDDARLNLDTLIIADPIRKKYWQWRLDTLMEPATRMV
uniref:Protein farnesyltransferase/geranylgeranyltransferase type-1 subunit alpha n=1 Tax=Hematodinium sp. SG-2015 TaxID=1649283 RepID=A0A0F6Y5N3_9DINO|nr:farnesyltransferase subunit alpha [Hematodinium sp. SG-2015]|eukprot:GEMP01093645.1.p1 GENE.GEMP01093645.1~~GEMP01093645.1.p1  ORF type:complete len:289 (+),score=60.61 GEMP01093645.1:23-868(+)